MRIPVVMVSLHDDKTLTKITTTMPYLGSAEVQTHSLLHARWVLYQLSCIPSLLEKKI